MALNLTDLTQALGYICTKKDKNEQHYSIDKFIEKPGLKKSEHLYKLKSTYWNSGIFLLKASTFISESKKYCKNNYEFTLKSYNNKKFDGDFHFLNKNYFKKNKDISVIIQLFKNQRIYLCLS